ncbi:D-alanyl-D-alanine carboxypeptidase family protein [Janibacter sp. G56]|uniref:D-alanyl-D-alanine carboxypeptidase family protein n=1 Tax=Janibacter sp. G56 TaxID=3418717 RepID=UPI003D087788
MGGSPNYGSAYEPLTDAELEAQIAQAQELRASLLSGKSDLATALKDLDELSRKANTLLQRYATLRGRERDARAEADDAREAAAALDERLEEGRAQLREWAFNVYTQGGSYAESMAIFEALASGAESAGNPVGDLTFITEQRFEVVEALREAAVDKRRAKDRAEKAETKAKAASAAAQRDRKAMSALIRERQQEAKAVRSRYAKQIRKAGPVAQSLLGMRVTSAAQAREDLIKALELAGQDVAQFEGGAACSDNDMPYPNGQVPPSGLCPMIGSPDEALRPASAAAFNAMSKAYQQDTGHLLCVTDGYRSYAEQVVVKAERGRWAATPGLSEHGFGQAVDLCGGVNSFGHPAHMWMQQNAPLFGWFHPDWAEPTGSLPEPWHWEFAG